jgi:hypothetical protein
MSGEITSVAQLTGVVFVFGHYSCFFELARLSALSASSLSAGISIIGILDVVCSSFLIGRTG